MAASSQGNPWYIAGFVLVVFLLSWHFFTLRSSFDQRGLSDEQLQMMEFNGDIVRADALEAAWRPAAGAGGAALPHGLGWFVQAYNGETVVWQFGVGDDASSSLVITVPAREFTLVLFANSDRLVRPFALAEGDLTVSPFARLFLGLFVR